MDEVIKHAKTREEETRQLLLSKIDGAIRRLEKAACDIEAGNGSYYLRGILQNSDVDVAAATHAAAVSSRQHVEVLAMIKAGQAAE